MHNCSSEAKLKINLEALVVENQTDIKKKPKTSEPAAKKERKEKKPKDANKRKRPPTAFFVFMEDFRKTFKEEHPDNKSVAAVAKEGGVKWKSLTDEGRKHYIDIAAERKAEYEQSLKDDEENNNEV